jgi:uncharacterized membrane protein YedE/YeeE
MFETSWWSALLGGTLIGASASLLWVASGKVAGISGILAGALAPAPGRSGLSWQHWFLLGLMLGGLALVRFMPMALAQSPRGLPWLLGAGLLVGVGTALGNGCTSGHGVCGISRGATRSIVATLVFMSTGMLAVFALRHGLGVAP